LLQALKQAGKHLVVSMHRSEDRTALAAGITQLADSIVVPTQKIRVHLIRMGVPPSKIEVISACGVEQYPRVYHDLLTRRGLGRARVRWEGPQLVNHSLALVNREMELALLQQRNVELTIAPTLPDTFTQSLNSRVSEIPIHYGCSLTGPADVHIRHQWPPNWQPPQEGRWVVIQPWEYGALPEEWVRPINRDVDEVWAPSTFVRNLYLESGVDAARVCVVPNGVDADFFKPGGRPYPLKSAKKFKFLFLGGTIHRKGIDVLLDAYCRAFTTADDVSLVIKDMGASGIYRGQGMGDRIRQLQSQTNVPHILYLDRDLTDDQMVQLYNACDCLVHPYRGEGFALPVLEAMSCALPVVVTAGGATDDFVDDKTGYRIPARRQVFGNRAISGLKTVGDLWLLEPDIEALIQTLTRVFRNAEEARDVGKRARLKVESGWTWKHAADIAASRIEELRSRPILRHLKPVDAAVWIEGVGDDELADIVESVKRHTYGSVALFARSSKASHPEIQPLDGDFTSALRQIRSQVRAPFTAVVTGNIRFSKHWLSQLADVTRAVGEVSAIVLPSMEIRESSEISDAEFQKMARVRWRERRGTYRRSAEVNPACVLVTSNCLAVDMEAHNAEDWLTRLQHHGVPAYVAEDTLVACLPMERAMTHHA
jgi:glycosyltransferase involved in cell wall biosynthesis